MIIVPKSHQKDSANNSTPSVVLHLTGMTSTKFGGMEGYLLEVAHATNACGYRTLLQYEDTPLSNSYISALKEAGVEYIALQTNTRSLSSFFNIIRLIARVRPKIIQTHFSDRHVVLVAGTIGRLFGVKKVISMVHNVLHLTPKSTARYVYNRCDKVLGVSQAVCDDLLNGAVSKSRVKLHLMGVSRSVCFDEHERKALRQKFDLPPDALVIGNISFDAPFKGIDVLLESISLLLKKANLPEVYLLQIGVDPGHSALCHRAKELGISDRVLWVGIVDNGWRYLNVADLYVQSSRNGEGLPLAIMEAMAMSLPVIATKVSGNQEAVTHGETGLLCHPNDPESLAQSIIELLCDPEKRFAFGVAGRTRYSLLFDQVNSARKLVDNVYAL